MSIELTPAQARAVAELAESKGGIALHQLADAERSHPKDVYATPLGVARGYRIVADGQLTAIGETLPASR